MSALRRGATAGALIIAALAGAVRTGAQVPDSARRIDVMPVPGRPDSTRICIDYCHGARRSSAAFRVEGVSGELLYMSPADAAARDSVMQLPHDVRPQQVYNIEILKGASAAARYGPPYASGLIIITLTSAGTEVWRKAVADSAAAAGRTAPSRSP